MSKSLRLPREKHFELQKVVRDRGVLTVLASKSFSRAGVVFDFQIALARRRGANFATSSAADPPRPPVLRS